MRRREQREHIFKLLFISEFNTQKEMEEQLALYLADIENLEESDRDYISRTEHGDDPESVMQELLDSSLSEIREATAH